MVKAGVSTNGMQNSPGVICSTLSFWKKWSFTDKVTQKLLAPLKVLLTLL